MQASRFTCAFCPVAIRTMWSRRSSRLWRGRCVLPSLLTRGSRASPARRAVSDPVTVPWHSARQGRGMLILRGRPDAVSTWARRGLGPVHVVPLEGWTAVLPAGPSRALPPYDDTIKTLAGRHVASRLRSAIGLFAVDGNAVITVHPTGWRAIPRWFLWSPAHGVTRPWHLAPGRPADLLSAAGIPGTGVRREVRNILVETGGDAHGVLGGLMALLSLPGSD